MCVCMCVCTCIHVSMNFRSPKINHELIKGISVYKCFYYLAQGRSYKAEQERMQTGKIHLQFWESPQKFPVPWVQTNYYDPSPQHWASEKAKTLSKY